MSERNLPALRSILPPDGIVFFTPDENPLVAVSADLCKIASFLQDREPSAPLCRFDDWWEHDGLHFEKGNLDIHALFQIVGTPRSLLWAMPGDHRVFVAVAPTDRAWYLRFFADWDENDESLVGEYSMTMNRTLVDPFQTSVVPKLRCSVERELSSGYFDRIGA